MAKQPVAKIVFKNRLGNIVRSGAAHGEYFYINYHAALTACRDHLNRCKEGAYVEINDQPKFTFDQMDMALYTFFRSED